MIRIRITDTYIATTEDFENIYIDGAKTSYSEFIKGIPKIERREVLISELSKMIEPLLFLNEKSYCIELHIADREWDTEFINQKDKILEIMTKLP